MRALSVDLGIRGCGVTFYDSRVRAAAYLRNPVRTGDAPDAWEAMAETVRLWLTETNEGPVDTLAFERMKVYQAGRQKGDPADLITLSLLGGFLAGLLRKQRLVSNVVAFAPWEWKGTVTKSSGVVMQRVKERLTPEEKSCVTLPDNTCPTCSDLGVIIALCQKRSCLAHNVYDSLGIALKLAGQFERKRVFAR